MIAKLTDWWRNVRYGVRNLWRFLPVVWRWRGWDYEYSYELFMVGLHHLANDIARHGSYEGLQGDVEEMCRALELWHQHTVYEYPEPGAWEELHDHMKENARGWWG